VLLGVLVAVVTMRGGSADPVTQAVYAVAAGALLVFAVWTAATAARSWVIFQDLFSGEEPGRGAPDRGHRAVEGPVGRPTTAEVATREALGGHAPAQRPCLFLFSSPPLQQPTPPAKPDIPLLCPDPGARSHIRLSAIRLRASTKRAVSNTPGRPARGSAEPTLSTAAAGFARGPSLRAGGSQ
jgi:hypothetical protein